MQRQKLKLKIKININININIIEKVDSRGDACGVPSIGCIWVISTP